MISISVIVPIYNAEKYLCSCIKSIVLQTIGNFELILIDDGSTDSSGKICDEYAKFDSRIVVIHQKNGGVSKARNAGLDIARGEYIIFCDSDDNVECDYLERLYKYREFDFVTAGFKWESSEHLWQERTFKNEAAIVNAVRNTPANYLGKYYFGSPWAKLFKKRIIDNGNIRFEENIKNGEDTIFILDYLMCCNSIKILDMCGYKYCFYENSLVRTIDSDYWMCRVKVAEQMRAFFHPIDKMNFEFLYEYIYRIYKDLIYNYCEQWSEKELYRLYRLPVFAESIVYMRRNGVKGEKIFILFASLKIIKVYNRLKKWVKR